MEYGKNEHVFYRKKTFGRKNWIFKKLRLKKEHVRKMKAFCKKMAEAKTPFNYSGFFRALTAYPRYTDKKAFFCSELLVCAFQEIGMMLDLVPNSTTPTMLHNYVKKIAFADVSPVYESRIEKEPLKFMNRVVNNARIF